MLQVLIRSVFYIANFGMSFLRRKVQIKLSLKLQLMLKWYIT